MIVGANDWQLFTNPLRFCLQAFYRGVVIKKPAFDEAGEAVVSVGPSMFMGQSCPCGTFLEQFGCDFEGAPCWLALRGEGTPQFWGVT